MINTCNNKNWNNPTIYENYEDELESIDIILQNLKKDPEYYNHSKEQEFSRFDRDD